MLSLCIIVCGFHGSFLNLVKERGGRQRLGARKSLRKDWNSYSLAFLFLRNIRKTGIELLFILRVHCISFLLEYIFSSLSLTNHVEVFHFFIQKWNSFFGWYYSVHFKIHFFLPTFERSIWCRHTSIQTLCALVCFLLRFKWDLMLEMLLILGLLFRSMCCCEEKCVSQERSWFLLYSGTDTLMAFQLESPKGPTESEGSVKQTRKIAHKITSYTWIRPQER